MSERKARYEHLLDLDESSHAVNKEKDRCPFDKVASPSVAPMEGIDTEVPRHKALSPMIPALETDTQP